MNDRMPLIACIVFGIALGLFVYLPFFEDSNSEMQYYQPTCIGHKGHKVCKADEQLIYFNLTGQSNLTETEIDSLAEQL